MHGHRDDNSINSATRRTKSGSCQETACTCITAQSILLPVSGGAPSGCCRGRVILAPQGLAALHPAEHPAQVKPLVRASRCRPKIPALPVPLPGLPWVEPVE